MPSKSLYRKYRPQTFADVVGQEHIEQTLRNALANDRVAHAYLFCGPRGTGKTTTARLLAKALLCEQAPTANPCGVCDNCIDIAESTHPDVYEIDAASRTGVDNVREEIIGKIAFSPTRGRYKVYIIDEVHMLSTGAFNALLKTLEEPPDHVVFVLCTTEVQKVPQTIISRCQRFDFHSLSTDQICSCLEGICDGEGFGYEQEAIELIAEQAKGGMRDAITALEQVAVFGNGNVTFVAARNMFGDVDTAKLSQVVDCIARRDMAGCFSWVADLSLTGIDVEQVARDLASYVRNLYVVSVAGASNALPPMSADEMGNLERQGRELGSPDRIANMLVVLGDLIRELRVSTDARLSLEIALTRMAHPAGDLTLEALSARIDALEAGGASGGSASSSAPAASTDAGWSGDLGWGGASTASRVPAQGGESSTRMVDGRPAVRPETLDAATATAAGPAAGDAGWDPAADASAADAVHKPSPGEVGAAASSETGTHLEERDAVGHPVQGEGSIRAAEPAGSSSYELADAYAESGKAQAGQTAGHAASYLKDPGSLRRLWDAAVRSAGEKHPMIPGLMEGSRPHANLREMKITVELPSDADFAMQTLSSPDSMQLMRDALKKSFGTDVQLEYRLVSAPAASRSGVPASVTPPSDEAAEGPAAPVQDGTSAGDAGPGRVGSESSKVPSTNGQAVGGDVQTASPLTAQAGDHEAHPQTPRPASQVPAQEAPSGSSGYDTVPIEQYEDLARYVDSRSDDAGPASDAAWQTGADRALLEDSPQAPQARREPSAGGDRPGADAVSVQNGGSSGDSRPRAAGDDDGSQTQAAAPEASAPARSRQKTPASRPVSGDDELAEMLGDVFSEGVVYRDPSDGQ